MNGFSFFLLTCVLLSGWGCTSTSHQTEVNRFSFIYNDQVYSIVSMGVISGNAMNYLLLQEGDTILLRGRDNNLDGILDTLLEGSLSLEKANAIYSHGITQAVSEGKHKQPQPSRAYFHKTSEGYYVIQSYGRSPKTRYNEFVIYNATEKTEVIFLDMQSDGTLDQIKSGNGDLQTSQSLYKSILEAGIQAGQIVRTNGFFLVEPSA